MEYNGNKYESDLDQEGISYFYLSDDKWAYSSTGLYFGNSEADYIATNTFSLNITGPHFYQTARLSPSSLKYYGLCLLNGNYNVKLHFAEIMFSNDQTFSSLGRRIFDVSIQGRKYLSDFNIMEEAGGVGEGIVKDFNVDVNDNSLEIHLYWAGKGTTAIPNRGVYGPLISAISVTPNFKLSPSKGLSAGAIVGIVVAVLFVILILILFVLRKMGFLLGGKNHKDKGKIRIKNQTGVSDDEM
ncbi:probable LRR receptor-like serine/threonine-protein kinase At1g53430 [Neltuma alba]|uniref:probable LRR receptor-like serine/threonine-protein kinase At1g53430 n=1 Tax=Neltuma alba TaxID=207710 RepID=UPI0010A37FC9|nr:probable LRR receptor-like serine/threonine-protein kinase At1g53430 [Prosopis alba]